METGDGWLLRARVGGRAVTAVQWAAVAGIASELGNGLVEVTMRANLQVRGVPGHRTGEATARLVDCGLAAVEDRVDRRRAVVIDPLAALAPAPRRAEGAVVLRAVEDAVERHAAALPPKWWAVVDVGGPWPVPTAGSDLALAFGDGRWCLEVAERALAAVPDPVAVGAGPIAAAVAIVERCAAAGVRARELLDPLGDPAPAPHAPTPWWGLRQHGSAVVAAAAPALGVSTAAALASLVQLAAQPGVSVHPTPQRGIVAVAPAARSAEVRAALTGLSTHGWIVDDRDPRRLLSGCIGIRGCTAALVDTVQVASQLAATGRTHVSACSKRCGAPAGIPELVATADGLVEWRP